MKIKWVKISNFRSITDTQTFYLNSELSILAGKNESGKSNILKALKAFGDNEFNENDFPQHFTGEPKVEVCFSVSTHLLSEIDEDIVIDTTDEFVDLIVERNANGDELFNSDVTDSFIDRLQDDIIDLKKELVDIVKQFADSLDASFSMDVSNQDFLSKLKLEWGKLTSDCELSEENQNTIETVNKLINDLANKAKKELNIFDSLEDLIPNFILFDSFNDILPDTILKEAAKESNIVKRFFKLTDYSLEDLIEEEDGTKKLTITSRVSAKVTGNFGEYYRQNDIRLNLNMDGEKLHFHIYDGNGDTPFKPNQRSQGFQWFLSFFLTMNSEMDDNSIILVDEPGLYLHAKAQNDILTLLEQISSKQQVIFTTHSPYLIDANRLERVRLVNKNEHQNTLIENKIHRGADKDTMTPVITSIGLDLTRDLTISSGYTVLVEGISDYYYLNGLKEILEKSGYSLKDVRFIPSAGVSKITILVSLLLGWGVDFKVLIDNDKAGNQAKRQLIQDFNLEEDKICFVSNIAGNAIEDVFSDEDFNTVVLEDFKDMVRTGVKNSTKVKFADKVVISKKFMETKCDVEFSELGEETKSTITDLFKALDLIS
ncbi:ATP-dependent nuclease [Domibacillus tundrae]|uniref:ATP-dependent nuclease n=1 Tax=Domibacillus tundrae TaxID=1587527 RepID=UPI000617E89E|nr:AAA family ATPase [Domibacillus tundrae]